MMPRSSAIVLGNMVRRVMKACMSAETVDGVLLR